MENHLINEHYDDCYFSKDGGYFESRYVFLEGNNLIGQNLNGFSIGETGFGTGLNLLVLEEYILESQEGGIELTFTSVEKYPLEPKTILKAFIESNIPSKLAEKFVAFYGEIYPFFDLGWNRFNIKKEWGELNLNLYIGDVLASFIDYPVQNNCWFLDGHSPLKNPEMWSPKVFEGVAQNTKRDGTLATFTSSGTVKAGLRNVGYFVKRKKGFGQKRHMIFGVYKS